ncbi:hypothetical protein AB9F41_36995, partial [Rhizobium leguminosarum]|uniref:hypothetical protein n=1 Tax=Rhizobium leguminosarum TaxID=384 RepID=UPI003F95F989
KHFSIKNNTNAFHLYHTFTSKNSFPRFSTYNHTKPPTEITNLDSRSHVPKYIWCSGKYFFEAARSGL